MVKEFMASGSIEASDIETSLSSTEKKKKNANPEFYTWQRYPSKMKPKIHLE